MTNSAEYAIKSVKAQLRSFMFVDEIRNYVKHHTTLPENQLQYFVIEVLHRFHFLSLKIHKYYTRSTFITLRYESHFKPQLRTFPKRLKRFWKCNHKMKIRLQIEVPERRKKCLLCKLLNLLNDRNLETELDKIILSCRHDRQDNSLIDIHRIRMYGNSIGS